RRPVPHCCSSHVRLPRFELASPSIVLRRRLAYLRGARFCIGENPAMKYGLTIFVTEYAMPAPGLAFEAEARGFESLWFPEHTHILASRKTPFPGGGDLPQHYYDTFDPFLTLAARAAATK